MNVLVLGMGSNVSQGIVKALRTINGISIKIFGACISKESVGLYLCDEAYIMPMAADNEFISWYISFCIKKKIDIVFTGVEENIDALVKNRDLIEKSCKTCFVYPDEEIWDIGYDKYLTCQWLRENGISYPHFSLASDDLGLSELILERGFPLVAKPRNGKSSSSVFIAHSLNDLKGIIGRDDYVIQEYIGSKEDEYTVGCYFTIERILASNIVLHRYLKNGGTSIAEVVHTPTIEEFVHLITGKLKIRGPLNIQLRLREDGVPVCFEWNVRYSGATAIRNHFGFRDIEAAIREYVMEESVTSCFNVAERGMVIRVEEEIYFENSSFAEKNAELHI